MEKYKWGVEDRMRNSDVGSPREGRKGRQMKPSSRPRGQAASHAGCVRACSLLPQSRGYGHVSWGSVRSLLCVRRVIEFLYIPLTLCAPEDS